MLFKVHKPGVVAPNCHSQNWEVEITGLLEFQAGFSCSMRSCLKNIRGGGGAEKEKEKEKSRVREGGTR